MFRDILNNAIKKAGNQENLASKLDLSPTALTNKINGKTCWHESEIDSIINLADFCTACRESHQRERDALLETIRVLGQVKKELEKPLFSKEVKNSQEV